MHLMRIARSGFQGRSPRLAARMKQRGLMRPEQKAPKISRTNKEQTGVWNLKSAFCS
jgi:hypothetical protein